jgi:hypothetical protein
MDEGGAGSPRPVGGRPTTTGYEVRWWFVRHACSEANRDGWLAGRDDDAFGAAALNQAVTGFESLAAHHFPQLWRGRLAARHGKCQTSPGVIKLESATRTCGKYALIV